MQNKRLLIERFKLRKVKCYMGFLTNLNCVVWKRYNGYTLFDPLALRL